MYLLNIIYFGMRYVALRYCVVLFLIAFGFAVTTVQAAPEPQPEPPPYTMLAKFGASTILYENIPVCVGANCEGIAAQSGPQTRALAIGPDGTIYVALHSFTTGLYVATSTNNGQSFNPPVRIPTTSSSVFFTHKPEIDVAADGTVYIVYGNGPQYSSDMGSYYIHKSTDKGVTWSAAKVIAPRVDNSVYMHMAVDCNNVYVIDGTGTRLFRSNNCAQTWTSTTLAGNRPGADIRVDPITRNVYFNNTEFISPNTYTNWYSSSNYGATISAKQSFIAPSGNVTHFTGGFVKYGNLSYYLWAGLGADFETSKLSRINVASGDTSISTIPAGSHNTIATDRCGNIVMGGHDSANSRLSFTYSTDGGNTFSDPQVVYDGDAFGSVKINETNGDIVFLYTTFEGQQSFLNTYKGIFNNDRFCGYDLAVSHSAVAFDTPSQQQQIVITNTTSSPLPIEWIGVSGSAFNLTHNCPISPGESVNPLATGASCTLTISGASSVADATITINGINSEAFYWQRKIPVSQFEGCTATQPTKTSTRSITRTFFPTYSPSPNSGSTKTSTSTRTRTRTNTPIQTKTHTVITTPTATRTATSSTTRTATRTATSSSTPSNTMTATNTGTATNTRTATRSHTASSTSTGTRTATNTRTITSTLTATSTRTNTSTRTYTKSPTSSNTSTATRTVTSTRTATATSTQTNTRTTTNTPQPQTLKKAAVGNLFILGLLSNGTLVTWGGKNEFGETSIPSIYKHKLFMDVATTVDTAFGLDVDGNLFAWGGTPLYNVKNIPANARTGVKAIGSGANFVVVIKNDGSMVAWGENSFSQVSTRPAGNDFVAVDGGPYHACAIKTDTTVKCWGDNRYGQTAVPTGLTGVIAISAGQDHTVALLSNGTLRGWGSNLKSQINFPANLTGIVAVTAGRMCTIAVKADGTIAAWGDSQYYNFGPPAIGNAVSVASDNQNSIVGLSNQGVRVAGLRLTDSGINVSRTPTRTATPTRTPTP